MGRAHQRESRPTLAAPQSHATEVKQVTNEVDPIVDSEVLTQGLGTCPVIATHVSVLKARPST